MAKQHRRQTNRDDNEGKEPYFTGNAYRSEEDHKKAGCYSEKKNNLNCGFKLSGVFCLGVEKHYHRRPAGNKGPSDKTRAESDRNSCEVWKGSSDHLSGEAVSGIKNKNTAEN